MTGLLNLLALLSIFVAFGRIVYAFILLGKANVEKADKVYASELKRRALRIGIVSALYIICIWGLLYLKANSFFG